MDPLNLAYSRLEKIAKKYRNELERMGVVGVKLSGSIARGTFFYQIFDFGDEKIEVCSDYDIVLAVEKPLTPEKVERLVEIFSEEQFPDNSLEKILIKNMDIKAYATTLEACDGPSRRYVIDPLDTRGKGLARHGVGGKVVYGEEHFRKIENMIEELDPKWRTRTLEEIERRSVYVQGLFRLGKIYRIARITGKGLEKVKEAMKKLKNFRSGNLRPEEVKEVIEEVEKAVYL